jgi:hypothetical protein
VWWSPRRVALAVGSAVVAVALLTILSIVLLRTSGKPKDDMTWQELEDRLKAAGLKVRREPSSTHPGTMWYGERLPTQQFVEAYEDEVLGGPLLAPLYDQGNVRVTRHANSKEAKDSAAHIVDVYQRPVFAWGPFVFDGRQAVLDDVKKRLEK